MEDEAGDAGGAAETFGIDADGDDAEFEYKERGEQKKTRGETEAAGFARGKKRGEVRRRFGWRAVGNAQWLGCCRHEIT